jgi:hypothetical protein
MKEDEDNDVEEQWCKFKNIFEKSIINNNNFIIK